MAIYLNEITRPYLERLIKERVDANELDWIGKMVLKMLEVDRERIESMAKCKHKKATYIGEKTCCAKCGSLYEAGMGESWTIKQ